MGRHESVKLHLAGFSLSLCLSISSLFALPSAAREASVGIEVDSNINALSDPLSHAIVLESGANGMHETPECTVYDENKSDVVNSVKGAVLLIHGWAGQKDEVGDLYKDLAHQLSTSCVASLRFDVRGEAEREASNYTLSSTFESRVEDAQAGLDYLQAHYPNVPLIVVGFSLGGATAMELVSLHPDTFKGVVLWSSALNPNEIVTNTGNFKEVRQALVEGKSTLKSWADFTLTRQHIVGMLGYNPIRNLAAFKGQMLAIRGADDYLPAHEKVIFEASGAVREDAYYLGGADHIFNVYEPEKSKKEDVLNLSINWIKRVFNI